MRPSSGRMYWWRKRGSLEWHFGYCTYLDGQCDLVRMGRWHGDSSGDAVVSASEIEWEDYS